MCMQEDEAPAPVRKPAFGFGFGSGKAAGPKETLDSEPEEEEEEKPMKKGLFGGFGAKKKPAIEGERIRVPADVPLLAPKGSQ
jgi:hypothetical protein